MFALDLQRLLELAGDIQLFKGCYVKAIELYKLARVSIFGEKKIIKKMILRCMKFISFFVVFSAGKLSGL